MDRLKGKVVIITGGNSGVGEATAKMFAKEGATVVITARREAALEKVAEEIKEDGRRLLFILSPNDLVYLPDSESRNSIYKMVSCTGNRVFFIPETWATVINNGYELGSLNKIEMSLEELNIKQRCEKIEVDRLGRIIKTYK